ncbi:MAG: hypothetical protein WB797_17055 [Nocardioides sp.]
MSLATPPSSARAAVCALAGVALAAGVLALGSMTSAHAGQPGSSGRGARTHRVVVRPVDGSGNPAPGWTVRRERHSSVSCDGTAPAAVDDDVLECFPSAEYLPACWKSHHRTALCLRDARTRTLVRVHYTGDFETATAPEQPSPQDLDLGDGQKCGIRVGGAWGQLPSHPHWVGFYSCTKGSVYGSPSGDGVNRSHPRWTVHVWRSGTKDRVTVRGVDTAYFVGTAH